jgi:hypothetical protein
MPITMNDEQRVMLTISQDTAKFMLERAITHYNDAVRGGMPKSADFWDGYIKGIRNVIAVAEGGNGQDV